MKACKIRPILCYLTIPFLLLMLLGISSCDKEGNSVQPTGNAADTTQPPAETVALEQYVIVRAEAGEVYESKIALALQSAFASVLGVEIEIATDFTRLYPVAEQEIILGQTTRADEVYTTEQTTPPAGESVVEAIDQRFIAHYSDVFGAIAAGEALIARLMPADRQAAVTEHYHTTLARTEIMETMLTLKSIYADGMLFQQNKPIRITGTAEPGHTYRVALLAGEQPVRETTVKVGADGVFDATLEGIAGSYTAHTLRVEVNGLTVTALSDILIGELWLATGQSNMHYRVTQDAEYPAAYIPDANIRVMQVERPSAGYPASPIRESDRITWLRGDSASAMSGISAVGYSFCAVLREQLDVPVGLIQYAVGGAPIRSWMSPETAAELAKEPGLASKYAPITNWQTSEFNQVGAMHNAMAAPAEGFAIAGMLWYQGEQDLNENNTLYTTELDALYCQYCAAYGFAEGELPLIMPIIVPYLVNGHPQFYAELTTAVSEYAQAHDKIAALPVNDVSPVHAANNTASHPMNKRPIGERLAASALAMVYGKTSYPADPPHAASMRVEGSTVYLTFENVADGLAIADGTSVLRGFTLCGANGVYYPADAKIISPDCVAVSSPNVPAPVSVTYAYELLSVACNLGCRAGDALLYMAAPCRLGDIPARTTHTTQLSWADCDRETIWHLTNRGGHLGKYYPAWTATGAVTLGRSTTEKVQGDASLALSVTTPGSFTVAPTTIGVDANGLSMPFNDIDTNYRRYDSLTVRIKNDTAAPLTLTGLTIGMATASPIAVTETVAANSGWTTLTVDFDGIDVAALANVQVLIFYFDATAAGTVYLDDVRFCANP